MYFLSTQIQNLSYEYEDVHFQSYLLVKKHADKMRLLQVV